MKSELRASPPPEPGTPPVFDAHHMAREDELGDLLFAVVNLCRKAGVHALIALDRANKKFERRFKRMEQLATERKLEMAHAGLEKLDSLWDEAKVEERSGR